MEGLRNYIFRLKENKEIWYLNVRRDFELDFFIVKKIIRVISKIWAMFENYKVVMY